MLLKKSILFITLLLVSESTFAQVSLKKVNLSGKIIDKETSVPVGQAGWGQDEIRGTKKVHSTKSTDTVGQQRWHPRMGPLLAPKHTTNRCLFFPGWVTGDEPLLVRDRERD